MKKTKFFWKGVCVILCTLQSCSPPVPKVVNAAFAQKFPNAKGLTWHQAPHDVWIATFYFDAFHYQTAYYKSFGEFEALEAKVYDDEIPKKFTDMVHAAYPNSTIFEVFEIKTTHNLEYIFEIEDNGRLFGLRFQENGLWGIIPSNDYRFTSRIQVKND